jgi:hypothetical protein
MSKGVRFFRHFQGGQEFFTSQPASHCLGRRFTKEDPKFQEGPFLTVGITPLRATSLREERFLPPPDRLGVILPLGPTSEPTPKLISFQTA